MDERDWNELADSLPEVDDEGEVVYEESGWEQG